MKQCHRFLYSRQDSYTELLPGIEFLSMKSLDTMPHALKQFEVVSWFHTNDGSVHSPDPRFTHLSDSNVFF